MFDINQITESLAIQISLYYRQTLSLFFDDESLPENLKDEVAWQKAIEQNTTLMTPLRLLIRVANNEIPGDLADQLMMDDVNDAIQIICKILFSSPGNLRRYEIPHLFWETELGQVIRHCQLWLRGDDLISYTEAAAILFPELPHQTARMRLKRMVERGELTRYVDPNENNPQRSARVSREEVEAYK